MLLSESVVTRHSTLILAQGVWQSTNNHPHLLQIEGQRLKYYDTSNKRCLQYTPIPSINMTEFVNKIRLYKEHNQGWLLSSSPPILKLSFTSIDPEQKKSTQKYTRINALPYICQKATFKEITDIPDSKI